jgi:hypothetical protein
MAEIIWHNIMLRIANVVMYKSQGEDRLKSIGQKMLLEFNEKIERVIKVKVGYICNWGNS